MSLQHIFKNSSVSGKEPTASQLANGELSINYHADGPFLCCKDTAGVVRRIAGVWVAATAPGTPTTGQPWLDLSLNPTQLKIYKDDVDGWVFAGNVVNASTTTAGVVELSTNAETQAGGSTVVAVTPASLQSKMSDSATTSSATTIASSTAVKTAYDLANAALPKSGGTVTGALEIGTTGSLTFEGSSADAYETTLDVVDPTADRTITLPNVTGTVITTGDTGTVTSTMLAGSVPDSKLSTISSADKVSLSAVNIDGGTDIGTALADADLIIVDDGGNGTNRKAAATRITDYAFGKISGDITTTSAGVTTIKSSVALAGSPTTTTQSAGTNNTTIATTAFVSAAVDAARQGLTVKQACRVGTTANITLSGTQTIDGVAVVAGDRVLVKDQSSGATNGIYVCAAGAWGRATDFDADSDLLDAAFTFVEEGTANADSGWVLTTNAPITVGTTALTFAQFSGAGQITAGSGLAKTANTLSVASGGITSDMIADGAIVNADINASAAIAGTKISPNFGSQNVVTTGTSTAASFIPTSSGIPNNGLYLPASNSIGLATGGSERVRVTSAGLVGIGTSNPANLLHVQGDATYEVNAGGQFVIRGSTNTSNRLNFGFDTTNNYAWIQAITAGTTFRPLSLNPGGGNVGIGTTSPQNLLHIQGISEFRTSSASAISLHNETEYYGFIGNSSGNLTINAGGTSDTLALLTNGLERARIDSSGRLLVGTSSADLTHNASVGKVFIEGSGDASSSLVQTCWNTADASQAWHILAKSGGASVGTRGIVQADEFLGILSFEGDDGTDFIRAAQISARVDGTPNTNVMPGRLVFSTTGTGASSPTERMRLDSSGRLLVGTSSDSGGALLQVNANRIRIATAKTPASAGDTGTTGEVCWDANYIYVCTATNTWKRAALSTW